MIRAFVVAVAGVVFMLMLAAQDTPKTWSVSSAPAICEWNVAQLRGPWGRASIPVEVVDTEESRARGLMFRESMPAGSGMLFIFPKPLMATFWMKNTLIPLDMLFFDKAGDLRHIHRNAIPFDETPIPGGDGIKAVLELNAGDVDRLGIDSFTTLRSPALDQAKARWPCK